MLTVLEFCQLTGKAEATVRYWLKKDEFFKQSYWWKEPVYWHNERGYKYLKNSYVCDKRNTNKILGYLNNKESHNKTSKGWTNIAVECFERKMMCKGCSLEQYCKEFSYPPLKQKVLEFVRLYGEPR